MRGPQEKPSRGRYEARLDVEVKDRVVSLVRAGNYLETAAAAAGVHRITLYKWLRRGASEKSGIYRDLLEQTTKATSEAEARDVALIAQAAREQWQAAAWRLERKHPGKWGQRIRVTVEEELDAALDRLEEQLDGTTYARVLGALAGGLLDSGASSTEARGQAREDASDALPH